MGVCPLKESFPRLYCISKNQNMFIQSLISWSSVSNFSWNLNFSRDFNDWECSNVLELLDRVHNANLNQNSLDKRVWVQHSSGIFSFKSFFDVLSNPLSESSFLNLNSFGIVGCLPKSRCLLGLLYWEG